MKKTRVAIIGTGSRAVYMYGPVLRGLDRETELVGVWGRSASSAEKTGKVLGVPWFTDMGELIRETAPQVGIVCVNYSANGEVGEMALSHGLHVLIETPIAHDLAQADRIIESARKRGLLVEVAEQFHRRPLEQLKLKLIAEGVFGRVHTSFNDFAGHGYHGVSVMRSYIGFDRKPVRAVGAVGTYPMDPHWSPFTGKIEERKESLEHGIVWFDGGEIGVFHWTGAGYDSGIRWWRSSRFLAERGMGITVGTFLDVEERLSVLAPGSEGPSFITVERILERCDGGPLVSLKAHTGLTDKPVVTWDNPFYRLPKGTAPQWHDDEIGVAGCVMSLVGAVRSGGTPTYGPLQARLDQELILAIRKSAAEGGAPVALPMEARS